MLKLGKRATHLCTCERKSKMLISLYNIYIYDMTFNSLCPFEPTNHYLVLLDLLFFSFFFLLIFSRKFQPQAHPFSITHQFVFTKGLPLISLSSHPTLIACRQRILHLIGNIIISYI